jgi:hypothetical protein
MVVYSLLWRTQIVRYNEDSKESMRVVGRIFGVRKSKGYPRKIRKRK